jgi:hypothetical protein
MLTVQILVWFNTDMVHLQPLQGVRSDIYFLGIVCFLSGLEIDDETSCEFSLFTKMHNNYVIYRHK